MFDMFGMLKRVLKGEVAFNLERGEMMYGGNRIVAVPANLWDVVIEELEHYFGEASVVVFEKLGEAVAKSMRQSMGWKTAEEVLKEFPVVAKMGGFGVVKVSGDVIYLENLPVVLKEGYARHIAGFMRGLCLEPVDMKFEGRSLSVRYKTTC
ncbi:MAG: hypothetical protein ABWK05_00400 [Pyrobaculum sp.]